MTDDIAAALAALAAVTDERDQLADALCGNPDPLVAALESQVQHFRELVREILREVELGTLGHHTAAATARTLARTAEWRKRAGVEDGR